MNIKFYSAWYCPFAQRVWMALLYKQIDFDYIEVDPYKLTKWWTEKSRGINLVPVLEVRHDGSEQVSTIVDSTRVLEYLEELTADHHLLYPGDPQQRAELRFWLDHVNQRIVPYMYRFLSAFEPGDYRTESRQSLLQGMEQLINTLPADGPYFGGGEINALDLSLIPFTYRIDALLGHYRDFTLPNEGEAWQRYVQWYQAMTSHEVFVKSQTHGADYRERLIEFYLPYSKGEGQKDVIKI